MKKIKNLIRNLEIKWLNWRARRNLYKNYKQRLEIEKIMEDWITKRIIEGQTQRREELLRKQAEINELSLFIDYLRK